MKRLAVVAIAALACACSTPAWEAPAPAAPAAARPAPGGMVSAANPLAAEAGLRVLREGGSAVDAAVAVQAVLGLVEPQSSGLGGGAFMTYFDARTGEVTAFDGRETAPMAAGPDLFLGPDGKPLRYPDAVTSGRATGVPGAVAMLHLAHERHGTLAWNRLFLDAERLADQGFEVSPRLALFAGSTRFPQSTTPDTVAYFSKPGGGRVQAGDQLRNPAYADLVRRIAAQGPRAILEGEIAQAIVERVRQGPIPGALTAADLAGYRAKAAPALCRPYRVYVVCVPPPPSSGVSLLQALEILEGAEMTAHGPGDVEGWYQMSQASRLMYADRDRYVADPAFVQVPVAGLLDPAYVAERRKLIGPVAGPAPSAGVPPGAQARGLDRTREPAGTSHFVVVDAAGNAVSMTTTVESIFGSGRMVSGMFLNNQMTDFNFAPAEADGAPAANAAGPGKRPRSSMAPVIVLDRQGRFVAAVGSPGGSAILAYNLKALVAVLDWKLPMQEAIALPNLIARGAAYGAEVEKFAPELRAGLAARGVVLTPSPGAEGSGLHGIEVTLQGLRGGADPRREGAARAP